MTRTAINKLSRTNIAGGHETTIVRTLAKVADSKAILSILTMIIYLLDIAW